MSVLNIIIIILYCYHMVIILLCSNNDVKRFLLGIDPTRVYSTLEIIFIHNMYYKMKFVFVIIRVYGVIEISFISTLFPIFL